MLILVATYLVARLARHLSRSASRRAEWDPQLVLLVGRVAYIGILVLGVLGFLDVVAPAVALQLLGAVGLLGLAFGLAFQDVLKNFLSGVFLLLERPFRIGDEITVAGYSGRVETVLLRVTVLRTDDGRRAMVPNQDVYTSAIVNSSSYPSRLFTSQTQVPPGRDLKGVLAAARAEVDRVPGVAPQPVPEVTLTPRPDMGPSLEVRFWVEIGREDARAVAREVSARMVYVAGGSRIPASEVASIAPAPPPTTVPGEAAEAAKSKAARRPRRSTAGILKK